MIKILFIFTLILLFSSCSFISAHNYQSQIDRPVKNQGDYTRVHMGLHLSSEDKGWIEVDGWEFSVKDIWTDVSEKVERLFIPTYWRFLLTGDQFTENRQMKVGKLHSSIAAGLLGWSYRSDSGHSFLLEATPEFKYLFNRKVWLNSMLKYTALLGKYEDTHNLDYNIILGYQAAPGMSLEPQVYASNEGFVHHNQNKEAWMRPGKSELLSKGYGFGLDARWRILKNHEIVLGYKKSFVQNSAYTAKKYGIASIKYNYIYSD